MTKQRRGAARHRANGQAATRFRFAISRGRIAAFVALAALGFVLGAPTSVRSADEAAETPAATAASAESPPAKKPAEKPSAKQASKPIEIKRMPPPNHKVSADNPARFPADI